MVYGVKRKVVSCGGRLFSARHTPLCICSLINWPATLRGGDYFRVAETGAEKVKKLAQEHSVSKGQRPNSKPSSS